MSSRGKPTSIDIKAYWEAHQSPSSRSVRDAMVADGWEVSDRTVGRTVARGFAPKRTFDPANRRHHRPPAAKTSPEINAVNQVRSVAGDSPAEAVAEAMVEAFRRLPDAAKDRVKALIDMDEQELENQANKLVKVARYLLAEDLAQHTKLMMLAPDKAAKLYQALGTGLVPVVAPPMPGAGDDAKVVDHNPNEPRRLSPSAQAIADFRSKRGSVAA